MVDSFRLGPHKTDGSEEQTDGQKKGEPGNPGTRQCECPLERDSDLVKDGHDLNDTWPDDPVMKQPHEKGKENASVRLACGLNLLPFHRGSGERENRGLEITVDLSTPEKALNATLDSCSLARICSTV